MISVAPQPANAKKYKGKSLIILGTSRKLFAERGFHNVSTRELADAANVNEVTIFRNFGSKDNLLSELLRFIEYKVNFYEEIDVSINNLEVFLIKLSDLYYDVAVKNLDYMRIKWSIMNFENEKQKHSTIMQDATFFLQKYLEKQFDIDSDDAKNTSKTFISALDGMCKLKLTSSYFLNDLELKNSTRLLAKQFSVLSIKKS